MKKMSVLLVLVAVGGLLLMGCGADKAKNLALQKYADLRNTSDGAKAEMFAAGIVKNLEDAKLKLSDIHVRDDELGREIRNAYSRQAMKDVDSLRTLKANGAKAEELKARIELAMEKSGKRVVSDDQLKRMVAKNYLAQAGGQGAKLSSADYREATLKPNVVVKTKIVTVPVQPKVAKAAKPTKVAQATKK